MREADSEGQRADIWLWHARFFKTRGLATTYVSKKGLRITRNGQTRKTTKPAAKILSGDVLTFYQARNIRTIEVTGMADRRGPASEAQTLYTPIATGE